MENKKLNFLKIKMIVVRTKKYLHLDFKADQLMKRS
jgi:hypothetical protein